MFHLIETIFTLNQPTLQFFLSELTEMILEFSNFSNGFGSKVELLILHHVRRTWCVYVDQAILVFLINAKNVVLASIQLLLIPLHTEKSTLRIYIDEYRHVSVICRLLCISFKWVHFIQHFTRAQCVASNHNFEKFMRCKIVIYIRSCWVEINSSFKPWLKSFLRDQQRWSFYLYEPI